MGPALDRSINEKCNKNNKKLFFFLVLFSFLIFRHLSLPTSSHLEITRISLLLLRSEGRSEGHCGGEASGLGAWAREILFLNVMICLFQPLFRKPLVKFYQRKILETF